MRTHIPVLVLRALAAIALAGSSLLSGGSAAQAAPASGGTFTVNDTGDSSTAGTTLTLRKALLLARGGTGAAKGLNRALTAGEKAQLSGCVIDNANFITGGCGIGVTDTIVFSLTAGLPVIALVSELPHLDDTAQTVVDGGRRYVDTRDRRQLDRPARWPVHHVR